MNNLIILTGFSGTGKSAVGKAVASMLGWSFVDTDELVVRRAGTSIDAIFADHGEAAFRQMERAALDQALAQHHAVVATGGGAFVQEGNRDRMLAAGAVVCLEAQPETIVQRLFAEGAPEARPLLAGTSAERLERVRHLKAQRQSAYAIAHWTVHTDRLTVDEAAREVARAWDTLRGKLARDDAEGNGDLAAIVHSSVGPCPIYLGAGLLGTLGERCRAAGLRSTAYLFTDTNVAKRHAAQAQAALEEAGIKVHTRAIPAGEASKNLDEAARCYAWLAERRAERGHFIVAVGGGVVGDVAGFVAATYARGIPFVQVPTSLAAMVDASIGGKTAVDLSAGKNLVGAFHQPRFVLADTQTLSTLPPRELASGWAEAVKHGLILDRDLAQTFASDADAILRLAPQSATPALRRSVAIKARVVTQDERETLGIRTLLNYGHTLGHALEAATGYTALLHGEAVAIGMNAAGIISHRMGLLSADGLATQTSLLQQYGLPLRIPPDVDLDAVLSAMQLDKKTAGGKVRWVLLNEIGQAVTNGDVPAGLVREVAEELAT
jgi:shikimate kinase/3-dehydroquinate synthase